MTPKSHDPILDPILGSMFVGRFAADVPPKKWIEKLDRKLDRTFQEIGSLARHDPIF